MTTHEDSAPTPISEAERQHLNAAAERLAAKLQTFQMMRSWPPPPSIDTAPR